MIEHYAAFEITFLLLFIASELLEIYWQHAPNLLSVLGKLYRDYEESIWVFLLKHMSYSLALYLLIYTDFCAAAIAVVVIKSIDIGLKIFLLDKIFYEKSISQQWMGILLMPLKPYHFFISPLFYIPLVIMALGLGSIL